MFGVAKYIAELRTSLEDELASFTFASPSQLHEKRYLNIIDGPVICIVTVLDILIPSELGVVDFGDESADTGEVFLGDVASSQTEGGTEEHVLFDRRLEGHLVENPTAGDADSEIGTSVAYLCLKRQERERKDE